MGIEFKTEDFDHQSSLAEMIEKGWNAGNILVLFMQGQKIEPFWLPEVTYKFDQPHMLNFGYFYYVNTLPIDDRLSEPMHYNFN